MKKLQKIILILIIGAVAAVGVILAVNLSINAKSDKPLTQVKRLVAFVTESNPTDILWIGNCAEFTFSDMAGHKKCFWNCQDETVELPLRVTTSIDKDVLTVQEGKKEQLIVINDVNGDVELSADEYKMIIDYCDANSYCTLVYVGIKQFNLLEELGFIDKKQITGNDYSVNSGWGSSDKNCNIAGPYSLNDKRENMSVAASVLIWFSAYERK